MRLVNCIVAGIERAVAIAIVTTAIVTTPLSIAPVRGLGMVVVNAVCATLSVTLMPPITHCIDVDGAMMQKATRMGYWYSPLCVTKNDEYWE
jgi:hypothetical protein